MLRSKQVKSGTNGAGRISSVLVVGLVFAWSRPAFPDEQRHLQLAPIRLASNVGGSIGYTYMSNKFGTSRTAMQAFDAQVYSRVQARSFFWQPWLAQITGALEIDVSGNTSSYGPPPATTKSGNSIIKGDAALDLLQYSRFPFQARTFKNQSHTSGDSSGINSDYSSSGFDLTQKYRSLRGNFDSLAFYTHNQNGRESFGTEEVRDQLSFYLTALPFKGQTFRVVGGSTGTTFPLRGARSISDSVITNHLYQPNSTFHVASMLNLIKTSYTLKSGIGTLLQSDYNSQQLSSFASWRPISPLTMTSSVRLFRSELGDNGPFLRYDNSNFNLGANYAWSRLLRMYGSVNVNENSGIQTVSTNASLSAQKAFGENDAINIGGFRYTRFAGASVSNTSTTISNPDQTINNSNQTTTSTQSLGGNLGHALNKSTNLGNGRLMIGLDQRLSETLSTRSTPFTHLNSDGTLSWNHSEGRETTTLRLRATDSRTLSGNQNFFQLINLQASRNVRLLRHQSLTGDLTIQTSRSGDSSASSPFITTPSASLRYQNERVFAVKNLNFSSNLNITGSAIVSSQNSTNSLNFSNANNASVAWDNNLDYFIGKLKLKLYSHIAKVNNTTQSSLLFTIRRAF